jgi:uncharacterized protein YyaL (SSP411 family)
MANRLTNATSPYLLQHADNPVQWHEWGPDAFAEARSRDVPVLLSVGYAACHWCHVMAHESFEDEATAAYLNEHYVAIKVDREERPDIDAVYMEATQAMTGQGGWPMTCVLTPEGRPFFAGTYFPSTPRHGMPSFRQVLAAIVQAWEERRDELTRIGTDIAGHLQETGEVSGAGATDLGAAAVAGLSGSYDERFGGFGGAPKFPPSMVCEFLLRRAARVEDERAAAMAAGTLEAMARGGLYDQVGGGFARYSVDARWDVPHFEKMLYDNALLLRTYLHWWRQGGSPLALRVVRESAEFVLRELRTGEGGFASALDADSDGEEGAFYVWTPAELVQELGASDGQYAVEVFGLTDAGNFERGKSTLRLDADPSDFQRYGAVVQRLRDARERRTRPARDDKVVAAWTGLMISALAEAGAALDEPRYLHAAETAAELLVDVHLDYQGRLRRVSRDGKAGAPAGVLEDYAAVAESFLVLFGATGAAQWYERAERLVGEILARFDDGAGGFFDTAADAESLFKRPQDPADNASPSGQSLTAAVLVTMHGLTGDEVYRERSELLLARLTGLAERAPRFAGQTLAVWEALQDGPRQVAVVGAPGDPGLGELVCAAYRLPSPGLVVAQGDGRTATAPLLADRPMLDGRATAYACQHFVCTLPVTDAAALLGS